MSDLFPVVLEEQDGRYLASVPDVPGCVTGGADVNEAVRMSRDALAGCLCTYEDMGVDLPARKSLSEIQSENPGALLVMVDVDTLEYRKRTDTVAVRRTVSLPKWLDTLASKSGVSLSQVLQDSLKQRLT